MTLPLIVNEGAELRVKSNGQTSLLTWHRGIDPPAGKPNGSEAVCLTAAGDVVVVGVDGVIWYLPGGRQEAGETWEEAMRREVREEACAAVVDARFLGYVRSHCIEGPEAGLVLIRSFWRADVELDDWTPTYEMGRRRFVYPAAALTMLEPVFLPMFRRIFVDAGVLPDPS